MTARTGNGTTINQEWAKTDRMRREALRSTRPTQSTIRGWQSDGVLIARSRSMTGRIYRIASYRHYLRCDASLPCPAFEHRGVCQHVKDAARFLEEHSPCGEAQRRFSEQTYNDPLRTAIRARKGTQFPTEEQLDDYDYEAEREEYEAEFGHLSQNPLAPMHRSVVVPSGEPECSYCGGSGYIEREHSNGAYSRTRCPRCNPDPRRGKLQALYR